MELLGQVRDGSVSAPELLQNATSGGVRERGEGSIEMGTCILNHVVQYVPEIDGMQEEGARSLAGRRP